MSLCGIDEAGRGCVGGDLVVAGVILKGEVSSLRDSKKLTPKKREFFFEKIINNAEYHIVVFSPAEIDRDGLSFCIKKALIEIMQTLDADEYIFDGNSSFGVDNLQAMVKADAKIDEVSAASILAKVTHDKNILIADKKYPQYQFCKHKGYVTKLHIEMIKKYGYCDAHRRSYKLKAIE